MTRLNGADVRAAAVRLRGHVLETPIFTSRILDAGVGGHALFFKAECLQRVGAFKARGALNTLLELAERGALPSRVVAYSSGNHAQAVAWAGQRLGVPVRLFLPRQISAVKLRASRAYGADVVLTADRNEAEARALEAEAEGAYLIPPYDHDQVIAGQGTAALELTRQVEHLDALFAPCGGGGLLSGTVLAVSEAGVPKVFGAEPLEANDAARTLQSGVIFRWPESPKTIADGARTLAISERTLQYLRRLEGLFEISEDEILEGTQALTHFLKLQCEPTAALGFAAAVRWLAGQRAPRRVGVILSGGNLDAATQRAVWAEDRLGRWGPPNAVPTWAEPK